VGIHQRFQRFLADTTYLIPKTWSRIWPPNPANSAELLGRASDRGAPGQVAV